jgi:hypothetical protein
LINSSKYVTAALLLASAGFSTAAAAQQLGVPVCDEFLMKYEICLAKAPQGGAGKAVIDQLRKGWTPMAANENTRPALQNICQQMAEKVKVSTAPLECDW